MTSLSSPDLTSIQEARTLALRAKRAAPALAECSQAEIDRVVDAMAAATRLRAEEFARHAVEETGYGVVADKVQKNLFSSEKVFAFIQPMKTVGVVARHEDRRVVEIAEPFGVVAAVCQNFVVGADVRLDTLPFRPDIAEANACCCKAERPRSGPRRNRRSGRIERRQFRRHR